MKTILFLISSILIQFTCQSQETHIYRGFDQDNSKTVLEFEITNNAEIKITSDFEDKIILEGALSSTGIENFYYLKVDEIIPQREEKGYAIVEIDEVQKLLTFFYENTFPDKKSVLETLSEPIHLEEFMALYLVKDIDLKELQNFPDVTKINDEDLEQLKSLFHLRVEKLEKISEKVDFDKQMRIFMRHQLWFDAQLMLFGYKKIETEAQQKWIIDKLNQ